MKRLNSILPLLLCAVLLPASSALAQGPAPAGRTYFVYIMGLNDDPYQPQADCLTFDESQACTPDDELCLTWQRTEGGLQTNKESGFALRAEIEDEGAVFTFQGQGRVDARGRRSSMAAAAHAEVFGFRQNFVIAGRQVPADRCLSLVEDFNESQPGNP